MDALSFQINQMAHFRSHDAALRQRSVGPTLTPCSSNEAGTLIIADTFEPSRGMNHSHGEMVNMSARRDGFRGQVRTLAQDFNGSAGKISSDAISSIFDRALTPEQTRNAVATYSKNHALDVLRTQTKMVDAANASGARNSVLNLSMGGSVAQATGTLYNEASAAWDPKEAQGTRDYYTPGAQRLAEAYGIDFQKLKSSDPKVSGPERARFQAALAGDISGTVNGDRDVARAKQTFTSAVGRFESGKNSVVISSGNEGNIEETMRRDSHGYRAKLPAGFESNYLETPEATMVGATRWFKTPNGLQERVAGYSSESAGVDIYASGSLDLLKDGKGADTFGTSFSAPRVAAMMASLHKANPNMSSAQVEHLMKSKYTHQLQNGNSSVAVLDFHKYSDFMVGRRTP